MKTCWRHLCKTSWKRSLNFLKTSWRRFLKTRTKDVFIKTDVRWVKSVTRNETGTISRLNKKKSEDEELPYELFIKPRQTTNLRNTFANNMPSDIKLSKTKISRLIIQSGQSFGSWLGSLGIKRTNTYCKRQFTLISN